MEGNQLILFASIGAAAVVVVAGIYFFGSGSKQGKGSEQTKSPSTQSKKEASVKDVKKTFPAGDMVIFFGSQTGTAEGFSRILMEEGKAKGFNAKTTDLEDFSKESLASCRLAVFLMATYGEGEPTDNANQFYKWLKNDDGEVAEDFLGSVEFAVFGLGNRQYEHFNKMGRSTDKLLEKVGAKRVVEYGEGDDDGSLEEDFEKWKAAFWPQMLQRYHPSHSSQNLAALGGQADVQPVNLQFEVVYVDSTSSTTAAAPAVRAAASTKHFFTAPAVPLAVKRELRCGDIAVVGSTLHLELDIAGSSLTYETADNLAVLPRNNAASVEILAAALKYPLDAGFVLESVNSDQEVRPPFPTPCTVREALSQYLDIHGILKLATVTRLLAYVKSDSQRSWLSSQLSQDNRAAFAEYLHAGRKSLFSLLTNELSSCVIPLSDFMHIAPFIQPRFYTISSSSTRFPTSIHITVSITQGKTADGGSFTGLCSGFLDGLTAGEHFCRAFVRASTFRLPKSLSTPVIMIGPGTGIAPMRAFLQERECLLQAAGSSAAAPGDCTLYFGCKKETEDFIYKEELQQYLSAGVLTKLHLAFSRDTQQKVYVQHLLREPANSSALLADLDRGAHIYVCGATAMGSDVMEAIVSIVQSSKGISKEEALAFVNSLQQQGRYVQELWSA